LLDSLPQHVTRVSAMMAQAGEPPNSFTGVSEVQTLFPIRHSCPEPHARPHIPQFAASNVC